MAGRTGAGKSTLALAAAGFIPRVVRATLGGTVMIGDSDTKTAAADRLLGRVGIVFATPANQLSASKLTVREELAFGLENLGVRAGRDGRPHRRRARPAVDRPSRRPRAVRPVGRRAAARGDRQHHRDGDRRPRARRADRPARSRGHDLGRRPARRARPVRDRDPLRGARARGHRPHGPLPGPRRRPPGRARPARRGPARGGRRGRPATADARPARPSSAGVAPGLEFDEAAIAAGAGGEAGSPRDARTGGAPPPSAQPGPLGPPTRCRRRRRRPGPSLPQRRRGAPRACRSRSSRRGRRDRRPERVGQDDARQAPQRPPAAGRGPGLDRRRGHRRSGPSPSSRRPSGSSSRTPTSSCSSGPSSARSRSGRGTSAGPPADIPGLVADSLEAVGLHDVRATNPYDLDLSRRKLVALAGVLAMDPAVLVLDEPTTGQDADGIERVEAVVGAYRGAGRTVVAITHDMEFAAPNFSRIVVMRLGEVVARRPARGGLPAVERRPARLDRADAAAGGPDRRRCSGSDPTPLDLAGASSPRSPRARLSDGPDDPAERPIWPLRRPSSILRAVMPPRRPARGRPTSRWLVAVVLLGILAVGLFAGRAEPEDHDRPEPRRERLRQPGCQRRRDARRAPPVAKAKWTDCGSGFQCATIRVPKDYADPAKGTLAARAPAAAGDRPVAAHRLAAHQPGRAGRLRRRLRPRRRQPVPERDPRAVRPRRLRSARRQHQQPGPLHRQPRPARPTSTRRPTTRRSSTALGRPGAPVRRRLREAQRRRPALPLDGRGRGRPRHASGPPSATRSSATSGSRTGRSSARCTRTSTRTRSGRWSSTARSTRRSTRSSCGPARRRRSRRALRRMLAKCSKSESLPVPRGRQVRSRRSTR